MKHPILAKGSRIVIWWLAWALLGVGQSLLFFFVYNIPLLMALSDGFISMLLFGAIGLAVWFPLASMKNTRRFDLSSFLNILLSGALTVYIWISITKLVTGSLFPESAGYDSLWEETITFRLASGVLLFAMLILTYYLFISAIRLAEKASRQAQLEALVNEAELKILRSQLNPHFLFNSLNSISSLTVTDPVKAREMIVKLSDFMRYSLSGKNEQPVTLREEMESLRLYLDIEKIRFRERLVCEEEIDKECLEAILPGMLLQPLYENAIKHGVYESAEPIIIKTSAVLESGKVVLSVFNTVDPGVVTVKKGTGTGLHSVRKRLELFFGEESEVKVIREEESFKVILRFPLRKEERK
jgi:two-component system, LytTR family, sensor kinase